MVRDRLEESVGFVMGVTYRKLSNLLLHRLKQYEVTPEQWAVLWRVQELDGYIQKEIAERSGKDKPTTTRILDALEAKELVQRKMAEHDRRSFQVYITDRGRTLLRDTESIERQALQEAAAGISPENMELMLGILRQLGDNADALLSKN